MSKTTNTRIKASVTTDAPAANKAGGYFLADECDLEEFIELINDSVDANELHHATRVESNIPVYNISQLTELLQQDDARQSIMTEWMQVIKDGSGVLVLENAFGDLDAIDQATAIFNEIIADEKQHNGGGADHFAAAGHNDRIWNAQQKLCEKSPQTYMHYYANIAIDAICEAWLGPNYQMTAQVNVVHPGGNAQLAHRDYHLGFQSAEVSARYPAHVHDLSPVLTLQGGIAHIDMPVASGPTKLLPFSQRYRPGYAAWRRDDFRACFEQRYVQLPLNKGDALFFNPALFHAAGSNSSTDVHRMVNLLQVSSAFGRAMETVDRKKMCKLLFPLLQQVQNSSKPMDAPELDAVLAATAEGYSFPTNLDRDPPKGGLAPETQLALCHRALNERWSIDDFNSQLDAQTTRQQA